MFVFTYEKELNIIIELCNRRLLKLCPEYNIIPEYAEDCINFWLIDTKEQKHVTGICLRNASDDCIRVAIRGFYFNLMRDNRKRTKKQVEYDFQAIQNSVYYRFD